MPYLLRRGPETANPFYGTAVHQDYGLSADDYEENVAAYGTDEAAAVWRKQYDRDEVTGFLVINFWRTVYMDEPLRHLPLTICDPYSVEPALKNFQCWKAEPPTLRTCFHSAFDEPDPPEQASERQSCEYRIGVYFLND